ncbi:MAG TPA: glycosyltransferase family 2 protein [Rhizomicrobium sp.]|jgi:dolichol-phosphate mannosyltransferase|nr:glycosyltransferase family 2 protein [Rhizomicrobium sp.]
MPLQVLDAWDSSRTKPQQPTLSVVIPTYDEVKNILPLLRKLESALKSIDWEVIFADDDSPDGTHSLAKKLSLQDRRIRCLRRVGRRGLAGACIDGILASSAPYVAVMDGDLQHDETLLVRMLRRLEDGEGDIVVGTRYVEGGSASAFSLQRGLLSRTANGLTRKLLGVSISDPMSGFFMVRRDMFEKFAPSLSHEGFKILLDLLATSRHELRVIEEPYVFRSRQFGESKFNIRIGLEFIGLIAARLTNGVIEPRFVPYAFVGLLGLAVHFSILSIALNFTGFEQSQAMATFGAMLSNFAINNVLTYRDMRLRGLAAVKGAIVFCLIGATGFIANIGVATLLYGTRPVWWLAGAAGALIGSVWNFSMSNRLVWRRP